MSANTGRKVNLSTRLNNSHPGALCFANRGDFILELQKVDPE